VTPDPPERLLSRGFWIAFASSLCYFVGIGIVLPVLPLFVTHQLHGNNLTVGIVVGIFAATAVLARPIAGRLGNRTGRRTLMMVGAVIAGASVALYGVAAGLGVLVLLRLVTGIGEGFYFTGSSTLVADMAPEERRAQLLSYFSVALFMGLGAGPLIGQALYTSDGATATFLAAGLLGLVASVVAARVPEPPSPTHQGARSGAFLNRRAIGPAMVLTLGIVSLTAFQAYVPLYAQQLRMGGSQYVFLLYAAVVLVMRIAGASLADRFGVTRIASLASAAIVVGLGIMGLWGTPAGLYTGAVGLAIGISMQYPALLTLVVNRVPAHERAAAVGTFTTAFDLSQGVSGVLLGLVASAAGYRACFGAAAGCSLAGLILMLAKVGRTEFPPEGTRSERSVLGDPEAWLSPGAD
jgi:MFS family permease